MKIDVEAAVVICELDAPNKRVRIEMVHTFDDEKHAEGFTDGSIHMAAFCGSEKYLTFLFRRRGNSWVSSGSCPDVVKKEFERLWSEAPKTSASSIGMRLPI